MATDTATRTIERELTIKAAPSDVWSALTEAREIQRWFAPDVESTPGEGGEIRLSWGEHGAWSMPIRAWRPGELLLLGDTGEGSSETIGEVKSAEPLLIRYELEDARGATALRLTHSGFGRGPEWDEIYDGTCDGWSFELRSLRHYLEHHLGEDRRFACASVGVSEDRAAEWARLIGPACLGLSPNPATIDEHTTIRTVTALGETYNGRLLACCTPRNVGVAIDQFNHGILRGTVERWCGGGPDAGFSAMVFLSAWGARPDDVDAFQKRWQDHLAATFA